MGDRVKRWDYCYLTASYFLLLEKKLRGQLIRLTPANSPMIERTPVPKRNLVTDLNRGNEGNNAAAVVGTPLRDSPRGLHNSLEGGLDDIDLLKIGSPPPASKDQVHDVFPLRKLLCWHFWLFEFNLRVNARVPFGPAAI